MEKLNFNKFTNLSQKDKKTLNLFNLLLSKKFSNIKEASIIDAVEYLISKLGTNTIHPFDMLDYFVKLKFQYRYLTEPEDTEFDYTIDNSDMGVDKNFISEMYFDYIFLDDAVKSDSFFVAMMNCFSNTPIKLEKRIVNNEITGERWEEEEKTLYLEVNRKGDRIFPVIADVDYGNYKSQLFYITIHYKEGQIKVEFQASRSETIKEYNFPVFWDDMRKLTADSLAQFICEKIRPEFIEFVDEFMHDNIDQFNRINENKTTLKNKKMSKIIKLTESDIEKIINKVIELGESHNNDDKLSEGRKKAGTKLCSRGYAAAKAKFKVFPSAYSSGYGVQVCKGRMPGLDGKKRCSPPYC